jgi:DNA (cytosine-5)-methyltransferase 1
MLRELALFAGAGGGILGGKLLGWRTVCAVEIDAYCRRVLLARQRDGVLPPFPIWDDVRTFDGRAWRGAVDIVTGGFPCQDISAAGKGAGIEGERSGLWREMARIIGEVRPRWVLVENSPMLVGRGLAMVLGDFAAMWYDAWWDIVGAFHVGAPHLRRRIWILAMDNASGERCAARRDDHGEHDGELPGAAGEDAVPLAESGCAGLSCGGGGGGAEKIEEVGYMRAADGGEAMADAECERLQGASCPQGEESDVTWCGGAGESWQPEPRVGRVAHGVAARVDRLRALGNGQVPGVVRLAWGVLNGLREETENKD